MPQVHALRQCGDHPSARAATPGDRLARRGDSQGQPEHGAEARPNRGGVRRIGAASAGDHAGNPGGVTGAQDRTQVAGLLDTLDDEHRSIGGDGETVEAAGPESSHGHEALVAAAECHLLERSAGEGDDLRAARREPRHDLVAGPISRRVGVEERFRNLDVGDHRTVDLAQAVHEREAGRTPGIGLTEAGGVAHPGIGRARDQFVTGHEAGCERAKSPSRSGRPPASRQASRSDSIAPPNNSASVSWRRR